MSLDDDLPTHDERKSKKGRRRLSGAKEVDVSASLEEFIGSACALLEEPAPIAAPAPAPEPAAPPEPVRAAEPDPIADRVAQIEEALLRAATRAAALSEAPPVRARGRLGLSAASAAIGAFLGVVVLLVGYGRSQGERQVSAAPVAAAAPARPIAPAPVAAAPAAVVAAAPAPVAAEPAPAAAPAPAASNSGSSVAAPPAASTPKKPARHKVAARRPAASKSDGGGIVDPFAN